MKHFIAWIIVNFYSFVLGHYEQNLRSLEVDANTPKLNSPISPRRRLEFVFPQDQADCLSIRNHYWDSTNKRCLTCPANQNNKMFAVYWESYVDGCDVFARTAGKYVTHVYWSFSNIDPNTGNLQLTLQGSDTTLKTCVMMLRQNCIKSLISVGGAENKSAFLQLVTPWKLANFQETARQLVIKYTLDGLDIADETTNSLVPGSSWLSYSDWAVVNYIQAIRNAYAQIPLQSSEPGLLLTWSEFPYSARETWFCNDTNMGWIRCYNDKITPLVDAVNIKAYNMENGNQYDDFINNELPTYWAKRLPAGKIIIGGCQGKVGSLGGCSWGAVPTNTQLQTYARTGQSYGGTMLWTGSGDYMFNQGSITTLMGQAGGYAHG